MDATQPRLIIPVHWDDFFRPLDKRLKPMPSFLDKFSSPKSLLAAKSAASGIPVRFQKPFEHLDPFAG